MISRRNFFSITLMMAALFFLFQFSQVLKEQENDYNINEYASGLDLGFGDYLGPLGHFASGDFVVYVGPEEGDFRKVVSQWCQYSKRNLVVLDNMADFSAEDGILPEIVLLDAKTVSADSDVSAIRRYMEKDGISFVFANLPEPSVIAGNESLMELLGIVQVVEERTQLSGIHLFKGFLLGGEVIYEVKDKDRELQDLEFTVPWFRTGYNTKTYMMGMLEDETLANEQLPSLIWRNSIGNGRIFVVSGDYMEGELGLGFLSSIVAEIKDFELYPVMNAQNVTLANLQGFSRENQDMLNTLYSRDQAGVLKDIVLPDLYAMMEQCGEKPTYFLSPQYDYDDAVEPSVDNYIYYMQQIKEQHGEAGWSLDAKQGTDFMKKVRLDGAYRNRLEDSYHFSAFYLSEELLLRLPEVQKEGLFEDLKTISFSRKNNSGQILSFYDDKITLQAVTNRAERYTYRDDLRLRAVETALGYSNVMVDLNSIIWPRSSEERWEKLGERIAANLNTYWRAYDCFDSTTLSESDIRLRKFMAMDYVCERRGNEISVSISGVDGENWFVLRTHGEEIEKAQGASFKQIEEDAYLICAQRAEITLKVKSKAKRK